MKYFIHLSMKMEPIVSSETSAIRTQTPGNYPKRNKLHLEHGESLKTILKLILDKQFVNLGTELNRIECRDFVNTALNLRFSLKSSE